MLQWWSYQSVFTKNIVIGFSAGGSTLFGTQAATAAPSGGLFGQQNSSLVGNSSTGGLFGSSNPNTFGQPKPVGSGFAFGASAAQPTGSIFGAPQTSTAATGMFGSSNPGIYVFRTCTILLILTLRNTREGTTSPRQ